MKNVITRCRSIHNPARIRSDHFIKVKFFSFIHQQRYFMVPKGKAPGHNGIPTEFFQEYVNEVAPTWLLAFKAMLARGLTSEHINEGMITLIPK
jgi:hypothetical protein